MEEDGKVGSGFRMKVTIGVDRDQGVISGRFYGSKFSKMYFIA